MKKTKYFAWLLALSLMLPGCAAQESAPAPSSGTQQDTSAQENSAAQEDNAGRASYQTITAEEAKARMDSGDPVTVLDVRTNREYEEGHIEGALLLPVGQVPDKATLLLPDLDAEILVYCRSGVRSAEAAQALAGLGYTQVFDFGGILDWPYETVTGAFETPEALQTPGILDGFTTEDLDGNPVDSSILEGYPITMVNVWATFCSPCINEMPDLGRLAAEYESRGVQIVGVVLDTATGGGAYDEELRTLAKEIVEETGADYLHLMPSADLIERRLGSIQAVPVTFFVDETGAEIGIPRTGSMSYDDWSAILDEMLETYGDAP